MRHKVGDRIRCEYNHTIRGVLPKGEHAIVIGVMNRDGESDILVRWENPVMEKAFADADKYDGAQWGHDWWKPAPKLLTLDRLVTTRDGQSVTVETTGDPERPYAALVRGQRLTFEATGRFYPTMDQPIDLVNI